MPFTKNKIVCKFGNISQFSILWLLLFCLFFGSFPISAKQNNPSNDLVYCPLQKKWVKKNQNLSEPKKVEKPLDEICSSSKNKESFIFGLFSVISTKQFSSTKENEESLFFKFLKKGERAFSESPDPNNLPKNQIASAVTKVKGGNVYFNFDFAQELTETFKLNQFARPPNTFQATKFGFHLIRELKNISRNINPRSPPFSI